MLENLSCDDLDSWEEALEECVLDSVKEWLRKEPRLATSSSRWLPTHIVAHSVSSDTAVMEVLLQYGADADKQDGAGETSLMVATRRYNVLLAEFLIAHGSDLTVHDHEQRTLLHMACEAHLPSLAQLYLERGLNPDARNAFGHTPIFSAFYPSYDDGAEAELVLLLLEHGASACDRDKTGGTLLHMLAVRRDNGSHLEAMKHLLQAGVDQDAVDNQGRTPLALAYEKRNTDGIWALEAIPPARDTDGSQNGVGAFWWALKKGDEVTIARLVANAHPNRHFFLSSTYQGNRPLHEAVTRGYLSIARTLIEAEAASVNGLNHKHRTPLYYAVTTGQAPMIELIAQHLFRTDPCERLHDDGDKPEMEQTYGTALHVAVKKNFMMAAKLLLEWHWSGDVSVCTVPYGETPLHLAKTAEMAQLLLAAGADAAVTDARGQTPLQRAEKNLSELEKGIALNTNGRENATIETIQLIRLLSQTGNCDMAS